MSVPDRQADIKRSMEALAAAAGSDNEDLAKVHGLNLATHGASILNEINVSLDKIASALKILASK